MCSVECIQLCLQLFNSSAYIIFAFQLGISGNAFKTIDEKPGISLLGDVVKVADMTNYVAPSCLDFPYNPQTNKKTPSPTASQSIIATFCCSNNDTASTVAWNKYLLKFYMNSSKDPPRILKF